MTMQQQCAAKAKAEHTDLCAQWHRICVLFNPRAVDQTAAYTSAMTTYLHTCAVEAHLA
jgi:hypothetical protein